MSSSTSIALLLLAITTATVITVAAKEYQVGDTVGWRIPATNETELYTTWASRRRFHIGDSLRFRYSTGSVVIVDKWGFYHCDSSQPISFFNDGNTVVVLDKVGTMYFISGSSDRCEQGQKMIVNVNNQLYVPPSIADPPYNPYHATSPSPSQGSGSRGSTDSGSAVLAPASVMSYALAVVGLVLCLVQP